LQVRDVGVVRKWILRNRLWKCGMDSSSSGYGSVESFYEHGNLISGCISEGDLVI